MKVFNKEKAIRKIKLKQNKNTYIKKVSISFSCFILLIGIIMFTYSKFEVNSEEYTLINGVVKYGGSGDIQLSYVVDGVSQNKPPKKEDGYIIKNVECTNANGTWNNKEWGLDVRNIEGKAICNLEFEEAQYNNVTKWLATANINKNYTTLNEVFNDTETLNTLTNNEASCDYLENSTDWINDVTSNENAMTYIGNNDYCGDLLVEDNNWINSIRESNYWDKVLKSLVPTMTNNNNPSGSAFCYPNSANYAYKAFDDDDSTSAYIFVDNSVDSINYIGYEFNKSARIIAFKYLNWGGYSSNNITLKLEAKDNVNSEWTELLSIQTNQMDIPKQIVNNNNYFKYYRLWFSGGTNNFSGVYFTNIRTIKFYGREAS